MPSPAKKIAFNSVMIALAAVFSHIENLFPISLGVPGVKLGLANIVILFALYVFGLPTAAAISLIRVLLVSFLFGNPASALYSLAGAAASLLFMAGLQKTGKFSIIGVSMGGGVIHPAAQLAVAIAVSGTPALLAYLPVLILTGLAAGSLSGIAAWQILTRLLPIWRRQYGPLHSPLSGEKAAPDTSSPERHGS
ncbi:MAG: Gx transporter family protein [Firmicutes bacterium]|nr:Gx transporter family protein [Bacillota bacterium]